MDLESISLYRFSICWKHRSVYSSFQLPVVGERVVLFFIFQTNMQSRRFSIHGIRGTICISNIHYRITVELRHILILIIGDVAMIVLCAGALQSSVQMRSTIFILSGSYINPLCNSLLCSYVLVHLSNNFSPRLRRTTSVDPFCTRYSFPTNFASTMNYDSALFKTRL